MKCLLKYQWVKLPRNQLPPGKGIMGAWTRLASRAAFRNGKASYCGHINNVSAGSWVGGIVGLKSILGIKRRQKALEVMDCLEELEYISYSLDEKTKKLTYRVTDWVTNCSGEPCMGREAVYATEGYGFLCLPKNVTQRLVERHHQFGESDAWLDIWCHTVWKEPSNAFSHLAPAVQFGQYGAVLTLESLGRRWGWEKTKVWRFFRKHADAFPLYKLPGSFGCLILNAAYPTGERFSLPSQAQVERILNEIRKKGGNAHEKQASDHVRICKLVAWYPIAFIKYKTAIGISTVVCCFSPAGRKKIHDNLEMDATLFAYLREHPPEGHSLEYADCRLSLLSAQKGKCIVSGEWFLQPDSIVCHMKVPKEQGGQERYSNLVLLHRRYLPLLTDQDAAALKSICKQLTVTRKQLTKINNLRTAAKLAAI